MRPKTVTAIAQDSDGVTATFDDGDVIRARYAVGADGIHSIVREQAGIGFEGGAYEESFVLADVRLAGDAPADEVILFWATAGMTVVAPLPDGIYRIVAPVADAPEEPSAEFVQQLLDTRVGAGRMVVTDVIWGSRFRIHHRVADTYRAGRLLLAGDAAHVHSPAGGQGMNLGIQDAVALADALAAVLGGEPETVLDDYSAARRPIAKDVVDDDRSADAAGDAAAGCCARSATSRSAWSDGCRPFAGRWPGGSAVSCTAELDHAAAAARRTAPRPRRSPRRTPAVSPPPSRSTAAAPTHSRAVVMGGSGQMQRDHRQVHQRDDHPGPRRTVTPQFARAVQARHDHRREQAGRDHVGRMAQHRRVQARRADRQRCARPPRETPSRRSHVNRDSGRPAFCVRSKSRVREV